MKKLICILLALVFVLSFSACKGGANSQESTTAATTSAQSGDTTTDTSKRENLFKTSEPVTDKNGDVVITCPASFFDEYSQPTEELTDEQKEKGFKKAIVNKDGSLSYVIAADKYESSRDEAVESIKETFGRYSQNFSYINKIAMSEDFSVIGIQVDGDAFSADANAYVVVWEIGLNAELAQVFYCVPVEKLSVDVIVTDSETGEVVIASHYPSDN